MTFRSVEIIAAKRDGVTLTRDAIDFLIEGYVAGTVPDYQMAAFCMATVWRGMTSEETAWLLDAMQRSGDVLTWHDLPMATADKHSTGGVGDKISIPLAPAVAACGVAVPMISGRGLGHTGGTLDKLESIKGPGRDGKGGGFDVSLSLDEFRRVISDIGVCMIGQTDRIVPADRKLYALRDVTATVESIPLIVASIMSKKLAEGAASLVLDVKVGSGAFMKDVDSARRLARAMVDAGRQCGRQVSAFLTAMDRPLGSHIGNALEIIESIQLLRGQGPADSREVICRLGGEMLRLAGKADTLIQGEAAIANSLDDGSALHKFSLMVDTQGGDPNIVDKPWAHLAKAPVVRDLCAWRDGYLSQMDALKIGLAAVRLGAGRNTTADIINPAVGFVLHTQAGTSVGVGQPLVQIHAASEADADTASQALRAAIIITDNKEASPLQPLWIDAIRST